MEYGFSSMMLTVHMIGVFPLVIIFHGGYDFLLPMHQIKFSLNISAIQYWVFGKISNTSYHRSIINTTNKS